MFAIDKLLLLAAILILFGVLSSKLSARLGLPVLVLFLLTGMLAGENGIGGIAFDNAVAAHALGTLALAMILFDGGLQTPISSIKMVWKPASLLATVGVIVTATIAGLAAAWMLGLPILEGMLLGAIVGSTDAAAVFSLLRNAGIHINKRLKSVLEIESASNDPMAIFLTVGLLEILVNGLPLGWGLLQLFVMQMGIGALVGLGTGWAVLKLLHRIKLVASGLYPVLVTAGGLLAYGIAANLGGSGFLAIFIAGVMIGNQKFLFQRSTFLFMDGLAWLGQITMFVVLGLLVHPASLLEVWFEGLVIAVVLVLIARPFAVAPLMKLFGFSLRETALVSWVGLRGSVPIILAIFPLLFGLPNAPLIFNVVFFVVLISATVQGSTLPLVARKLGLTEKPPAAPAATLEISALQDVDAEIVKYTLGNDTRAAGRLLSQMALPEGVVVAMITRGASVIPPRGSTTLEPGDHLFVVLKPENLAFVNCVFSQALEAAQSDLPDQELRVKGSTTLENVWSSYGIDLATDKSRTLDQFLKDALGATLQPEAELLAGKARLSVREVLDGRITTVGIRGISDQATPA